MLNMVDNDRDYAVPAGGAAQRLAPRVILAFARPYLPH